MRPLTRREVRDIDLRAMAEFGLPGIVLMENAGRNAANLLESLQVAGRIDIVCGKGNNAGDGFVMARHLHNHGHDVRVLLAVDPEDYDGDAAINWNVVERSHLEVLYFANAQREEWLHELTRSAWIVDALLGTGIRGDVREPFATAIDAINSLGKKVFAVDVPSGFDCDTGQPLGSCIRAAVTATFVSRKVGFDTPSAAFWTGKIHVLDIGAPRVLLEEVDRNETPALSNHNG